MPRLRVFPKWSTWEVMFEYDGKTVTVPYAEYERFIVRVEDDLNFLRKPCETEEDRLAAQHAHWNSRASRDARIADYHQQLRESNYQPYVSKSRKPAPVIDTTDSEGILNTFGNR